MERTQNKAARLGAAKYYFSHTHYKRFPAYGKRLMQLRQAGRVPPNSVVVTFDWEIGRIFPRVVIAEPVPFDDLEFRYLAGLDVWLPYHEKDASRVMELAQAILRVNPHSLLAFAIEARRNIIIKTMTGEVTI
ncbi:MAG: hypothetical protein ACLQHK_09990 [Gallionellaceae bacterium]